MKFLIKLYRPESFSYEINCKILTKKLPITFELDILILINRK